MKMDDRGSGDGSKMYNIHDAWTKTDQEDWNGSAKGVGNHLCDMIDVQRWIRSYRAQIVLCSTRDDVGCNLYEARQPSTLFQLEGRLRPPREMGNSKGKQITFINH